MKLCILALALILLFQRHVDARLGSNDDGWLQVSPNVAFQRNTVQQSMGSPAMNAATEEAISRILASSSTNPSYSATYDDFQLAWRLLGFYMDCSTTNSYVAGCNRQVLYAVYFDPNYEGGGIGEYLYYDKKSDKFNCYGGGSCKTKMDCHLSDTAWKLLGVFKIENIVANYGFLGQLSQHEGYCLWGPDTYNLVSTIRQASPYYCKATKQKLLNGSYLYYGIQPAVSGTIALALYTDYKCSIEYTGNNFDVYELVSSSQADWESLNEALSMFKQCQPCISYDLSTDGFTCTDVAGFTDANMCMKFVRKAHSKSASTDDIILATRQQGLVSFEMDGVTYGGLSSDFGNMTWYMNNAIESTRSASVALPFPLPELPTFVTSWTFLAGLVLFFLALTTACCKISCCKPSTSNEKSVSLLDDSRSNETTLGETISNPLDNKSNKVLSNVAKVRTATAKVGINRDDATKQEKYNKLGGISSTRQSVLTSYKSTACQTSVGKKSKTSKSALDWTLKALSNSFASKSFAEKEGKEHHDTAIVDKVDAACQTSVDKKSKTSQSALDWSSKTLGNSIIKTPKIERKDAVIVHKVDAACQTSVGKKSNKSQSALDWSSKTLGDSIIKTQKTECDDAVILHKVDAGCQTYFEEKSNKSQSEIERSFKPLRKSDFEIQKQEREDAECQTSFDKKSSRSQSALEQSWKTLSNSITKKEKKEHDDAECQSWFDKLSKSSLSALEQSLKILSNSFTVRQEKESCDAEHHTLFGEPFKNHPSASGSLQTHHDSLAKKATKESDDEEDCQTSIGEQFKSTQLAKDYSLKTHSHSLTRKQKQKHDECYVITRDDASFDKQSNRSQSASNQSFKTLNNCTTEKEERENDDVVFVDKEVILETGTPVAVHDTLDAASLHTALQAFGHEETLLDSFIDEVLRRKVKAVAKETQHIDQSVQKSNLTLTESILATNLKPDCPFTQCCTSCGKPPAAGKKLLLCKQCRVAEYCNKECQKADWSNHKYFCTPTAAPKNSLALR